ncbi:MAG: polysaccharide deacetylase family protein [Candidatus Omnitrophota bacterium]
MAWKKTKKTAQIIRLFFLLGAGAFLLGGCAGVSVEPVRASLEKESVPVLLYHHIADLPENAGRALKRWTLSPKKFEAHLAWIVAHGFHPVSLAQLVAHRKEGIALPASPIVLTFDDGWKDQYTGAFPLLVKYKIPATFFIITDSIGHSAYMDWRQLEELATAGMDVEPHSHTHSQLTVLPEKYLSREIIEPKNILESRLRKPAVVFAYPFGDYNDEVISMVKQAGFDAAVSVNGLNNGYIFRRDQTFTLARYALEGDDDLEQVARAKGFYQ